MKIETEVLDFESNLGEAQTFQLKVNGRAFRLLSKDVYSDPVRAVVRELGTNAMDSHIAAGKPDTPFVYHLPNGFEPWFAVKDSGLGLDADGLKIYTTYFESTKIEDNRQTGALGLGSKSPFAYGTTFTVEAVKDLVKRTLVCYLTADETPDWNLLSEEPTLEENGVTIKLPVEKKDFRLFSEAVYDIGRFFPSTPLVEGGEPIKPLAIKTRIGPLLIPEDRVQHTRLIMGSVVYRVPGEEITKIVDNLKLDLKNVSTYSFLTVIENGYLEAPLGAVDFAISREELQFTEKTRAWLKKAILEIYADIMGRLEAFKSKFKDPDFILPDAITEERGALFKFLSAGDSQNIILSYLESVLGSEEASSLFKFDLKFDFFSESDYKSPWTRESNKNLNFFLNRDYPFYYPFYFVVRTQARMPNNYIVGLRAFLDKKKEEKEMYGRIVLLEDVPLTHLLLKALRAGESKQHKMLTLEEIVALIPKTARGSNKGTDPSSKEPSNKTLLFDSYGDLIDQNLRAPVLNNTLWVKAYGDLDRRILVSPITGSRTPLDNIRELLLALFKESGGSICFNLAFSKRQPEGTTEFFSWLKTQRDLIKSWAKAWSEFKLSEIFTSGKTYLSSQFYLAHAIAEIPDSDIVALSKDGMDLVKRMKEIKSRRNTNTRLVSKPVPLYNLMKNPPPFVEDSYQDFRDLVGSIPPAIEQIIYLRDRKDDLSKKILAFALKEWLSGYSYDCKAN